MILEYQSDLYVFSKVIGTDITIPFN